MNFKKVMVSFFILSFIFSASCRPFLVPLSPIKPVIVKSSFGYFTENKGQWNREILFVGDTKFGSVAFARDGFYYQLIKKDRMPGKYTSRLIKFVFVRPLSLTVEGENILPHYNNYFVGAEPRKWNTECRNYEKIYYKNVWNGIDMAFFFTKAGLKYEFYVTPKANIDDLRIRVVGANLMGANNSLQINTPLGSIQDDGLMVWDQIDNSPIPTTFTVQKDTYFFAGIPKLRKHTITIDPMVYSTYLGGASEDHANAIVVDSLGYTYSAGYTYSSFSDIYPLNLPIIPGVNQTYNAMQDVFVGKIAPDGTSLDAFTYFGSTEDDVSTAIALDSSGYIYITGYTTTNTATAHGGPPIWFDNQPSIGGLKDIFVLKLNFNLVPQGSSSDYIKYIGKSEDDVANAIALGTDDIYITGFTKSDLSLFSATANGGPPIWFDNYQGGSGNTNSFVIKLPKNLSQTTQTPPSPYYNFFGGIGDDVATAIALDSSGYIYITGYTTTNTATAHGGPPIWFDTPSSGGAKDIFVLKLNSNLAPQNPNNVGSFIKYIGSSGDDVANAIALDALGADGFIYITGSTTSNLSSFPGNSNGGPPIWFDGQPGSFGAIDSFVIKLPKDLTLTSQTNLPLFNFFGGNGVEVANAIALDSDGKVFITGSTTSSVLSNANGGPPIWFDGQPNTGNVGSNTFILKLGSDLKAIAGQLPKFIGGTGDDVANAITLDSSGNIYITGYTTSPYSGSNSSNWFDTIFGGNANPDALIFKVTIP